MCQLCDDEELQRIERDRRVLLRELRDERDPPITAREWAHHQKALAQDARGKGIGLRGTLGNS